MASNNFVQAAGIIIDSLNLAYFARDFLSSDVDDSDINQKIFKFFGEKFDLCADFKRLYVDGRTFNSSYPEAPNANSSLKAGASTS